MVAMAFWRAKLDRRRVSNSGSGWLANINVAAPRPPYDKEPAKAQSGFVRRNIKD
jgi:hypothetical protein